MVSFEALVERLSGKLKGIAYKVHWKGYYFNNDDLYQEALVHLWKKYNEGALSGKTDSYILQGCYFHLKNYMRTAIDKVKPVSLDAPSHGGDGSPIEPLSLPSEGGAEDYFESLHARMLADVIYNNGLSDKEKALLPLFAEGLTTRQIGARVGISHVRVIAMRREIERKCRKHLD